MAAAAYVRIGGVGGASVAVLVMGLRTVCVVASPVAGLSAGLAPSGMPPVWTSTRTHLGACGPNRSAIASGFGQTM